MKSDLKNKVRKLVCLSFLSGLFIVSFSCVSSDKIQFRSVENLSLDINDKWVSILKGDVVFYNATSHRLKIKKAHLTVFAHNKKIAEIDKKLNEDIQPNSEFMIPIVLQPLINLNDIVGMIKEKKHEILCIGYIEGRLLGFPIKVSIEYKKEIISSL